MNRGVVLLETKIISDDILSRSSTRDMIWVMFFWNGMFNGVQMSSLVSGAFDPENSKLAALKSNCDGVSGEQ